MAIKLNELNDIMSTLEVIDENIKLTDNDERLNFGIDTDFDGDDLNYYTYITNVKSRGNQPYSISDFSKIESKQTRTCKSCSFFRGEFGDKYLCKKPSSSDYLNNCFVNKKELDDLDFCIDYKYDYSIAEKSSKSSKKIFCFNQPFKDIWE